MVRSTRSSAPISGGGAAWRGAVNLRDLGGLPLAGGGRTASGRVFRSAAPEWMTDDGWADLRAAGVTAIVDLRNPGRERERLPHHPVIALDAAGDVVVHSAPTEDPDDPEFVRVLLPVLDSPASYAYNVAMYPPRFAAVFRAIAGADGAVLVHCSAGRDRTGMVTAVLLALAGVERDAIVDDYAAAAHGIAEFRRGVTDGAREPAWTVAEVDERLVSRRAALAAWLDAMDPVALLAGFGLDEAEIGRLRTLLR